MLYIRNRHEPDVASLRDAGSVQIFNHRTAQFWALLPYGRNIAQNSLYGVIEIKPFRGFLMVTADNHFIE